MATMKEIAELAGVSRGTVDRVLNHRGDVNPETEKKILEIVKLLNYQPNKAGIVLAAQKKKLKIGVLLFGSEHPFFDAVMDGLRQKLEELSFYGCTIYEKRTAFSLEEQLAAIDAFITEGIQGLILSPFNDIAIQKKIDYMADMNIPCITVNTDMPDSKRLAYIGSDYYKCGQTAAGLLNLITNGNANVGIITGSHKVLCHEERIEGFTHHLKLNCPGITISAIVENNDDDYTSYDMVLNMLSKHPKINALYFTASGVYGGCQAVIRTGLKLKVITFDALDTTQEMMRKDIISATICQQPFEQGANALSVLVDYLVFGKLPETELNHMDLSIKIKENL
ncbi:MAG: substrate-binding domain-containing protein [Lachnospiraceae bacterium]|nr:substrate-binding domain-containing protein [Lachnospiraceae bacterium]